MALGPGSIAIIGFNADGNDNLAFVVLEAITAGQAIFFEDNEWNGTGWADANENALIWTATSDVAAGTVVRLDNLGAGTLAASIGTLASAPSATHGANRGLAASDETFYAYTGSRAAPVFLTAVSNDGSDAANGSLVGTGLTYGINALNLGLRDLDGDIFAWKGARSGYTDFAAIRSAINATPDAANWDAQDGTGDQGIDITAPDVPFSDVAFSVIAAAPVLQSIAPVAVSQNEGSNGGTTNIDFTVTLSAPAIGDTAVALAFTGAADAGDFANIPASVTVLNGQTSAIATFQVNADTAVEPDENFTVTASLNGVDKQAAATIVNDDSAPVIGGIDLSTYVRVARYDLPEPTRTTAPANNLLAQEASGVTYNWDTDSLFIVGDGGRSVTQVSKTGVLIDTMTLAAGGSPQGTEFYDPEGITYIGNGQFVMTEERDRQLVKFTYTANTTLNRAGTQTVDLGTFVDNTGLEGLSYDPLTGGFVVVKEISPEGIYQTGVDFASGTATNGSSSTVNSINLFDPALANLSDFADVFALSNLPSLDGQTQYGNLLVLSQADGKIVNIDRAGNISSMLQIVADQGSPLSVANHQHEGVTMDRDGNIYVVNENGGGDIDHPQLWVYAKSLVPNQAPTAVAFNNTINSILENSTTAAPVKVADIVVTDDGLGTNNLTVTGADASFFEITSSGLFIKAGTVLDYETRTSYSVTVNVDDATLGATPDATADFMLQITDIVNETPAVPVVFISEAHPSGSGNGSYSADWFEITNAGASALDITGWQMDDNSNGSGKVALRGVTSIAPGKLAIFIEGTADGSTDAAIIANFSTAWFGSATLPAGVVVGAYGGSGVGLSSGGDAVNLFDGNGNRITGVSFGAATTSVSFDNFTGLGSPVLPLPAVSTLSSIGTNGAFRSANNTETGSPGTTGKVLITEVAPWSSGSSPVNADWFEMTNYGATAVDLTGWRMDDNSQSFAGAVALNGITSIAPGETVIFIESSTPGTAISSFLSTWFGLNTPPAGLQIGTYSGSGVGLSTGGDGVNIYDSTGALQASVNFGASDSSAPLSTFDNAAHLNNTAISQLSAIGINGAFVAATDANEIGSPGRLLNSSLAAQIASGNADQDSVILWAKAGATGNAAFQIATDAAFTNIVASQLVNVTDVNQPVKAVIDSGLVADTQYFYRFTDSSSTRTGTFGTPASLANGQVGLSFGVSGDWRGELAPYPSVSNADTAGLKFFVELGDTIYADVASPAVPGGQATTLDEYRAKHDEVYSDHDGMNTLGDLRATTPVFAIIDDHEVTNDFAGAAPATTDARFAPDTGLINESTLYKNGLQAFVEYNPIADKKYTGTGDATFDGRPDLYTTTTYGADAQTFVVDARSFRSQELAPVANIGDPAAVGAFLAQSFNPSRTMLGAPQLARLEVDLLTSQANGVTWKFVMMPEPIQNLGALAAEDRYEGYAAERTQLLKFIEDNNITNVVFISADIHGTVVNNLTYQETLGGAQIATGAFEITTGSVAYDAPFGQTIAGLASTLGLIDAPTKAFYDSLPIAPDADSALNDKDDFLENLVNQQLSPLGYDPVGLDSNLAIANGRINATLNSGDYLATHTFGWTKFDIDPVTQALTVTTYGVDAYNAAQLAANPDAIINDIPQIVSQFTVQPQALVEFTKIHEIQGAGTASPLAGQTVTVEAIVVGDFQNGDADVKRNINGFYLQEEAADQDGNIATSEGIFVFQGSGSPNLPDVNIGDRVRVTGNVSEFSGSTQINAVTDISVIQANAVANIDTLAVSVDLPAANVIQRPGTVANSTTSFHADLEAYEGMLVKFTDTMTISEQFALDQFVEVRLVAGDVPVTFTQENQPDVAGSAARLAETAGRTIVYDDGLNVQNTAIGNLDGFGPVYTTANAPRMGDTADGLTGVLDFAFNQFRVRSVADGDNVFTDANPRPAAPAEVGGTLKVASFNVLNYFTTLGAGITASGLAARGATNAAEFNRQTEKLVNVIAAINADVLGLVELENNFTPGAPGNAIEHLVNALNAELGANTYAWVNPGQQLVGGDAIAVGFIYKPSQVMVSAGTAIATLDDADVAGPLLAQSTIGAIFNGVNTSRVPLAVSFTELATGGEFTVVANHLKSKSGTGTGADADQLDGQGNWQNQRELAAEAIRQWIATDPTGSGDADVLLLGDFNSYLKEDTLDDVLIPGGYTNLAAALPADDRYSFIFDGQRGSLDHILASASAADQVTGVTEWHINADEADALDYNTDFGRDPAIFDANTLARVSDHDPIIVGLDLTDEATFTVQLLHFYAETGTIAKDTAPIMGAMIDKFDDLYNGNTLVLAEGDTWIPGPWLVAGADPALSAVPGIGATALARPDIAILNAFGADASALGNHEFDLGSPVVSGAIAASGAWVGAQFPFITANLNFAADSSLRGLADASLGGNAANAFAGKEASAIKGKIAPSTVVTMSGERIGIVGATTYDLLIRTSPNGTVPRDDGLPETDDLQEVAAYIQAAVDGLRAQGINKIVMVDQLDTLERNEILAPMLNGIDIMVAGGGHERMGDANDTAAAFNGHDANFVENYPIVTAGSDGKATLIVTTDTEFTYLGRLVVQFNSNGELLLNALDPIINGAYASNEATLQSVYGSALTSEQIIDSSVIGSKVEAIADAIDAIVTAKDGNKFGFSSVYLEGDRVFTRTQETNLGDITADANAYKALAALPNQPYMVSLKNGGGLRSSIGSIDEDGAKIANVIVPGSDGNISQLDVENALRFDNKLMVFDTSAQGLLNILNFGANLATLGATGSQQGGFPQIGGVKFSFDPDHPAGARVVSAGLINDQGELIAKIVENGVIVAPASMVISVVAPNFTANGGDGYPVKTMTDAGGNFLAANFRYLLNDGTLSGPVERSLDFTAAANVPANALGEQKAFEDYLETKFGTPEQAYNVTDTPAALDLRIENLNLRSDVVFANLAPVITGDLAINVAEGGAVVITTADLNEADPDNSGFVLNYIVTGTQNGAVQIDGANATAFSQTDLEAGKVSFRHDGSETSGGGFTVILKDAGLTSDPAVVLATVTAGNRAPVFTSAQAFSISENLTLVATIAAQDPDGDAVLFELSGGDDKSFFVIDAVTGALNFLTSRDFETREDANLDNVYNVIVSATDPSGAASTQAISVTVTDLAEPGGSVNSGNGDDSINGAPGNDSINAGNGNDTVNGGDGNDKISGGNGNDTLFGGRGDDILNGANGDDSLYAGSGVNQLLGGAGNDNLYAETGNNILTGGAGNDRFIFGPGFFQNVIADFGNTDRIEFDDVFADFLAVQTASQQVGLDTVIALDASHTITLKGIAIGSLDASDFLFS